MKMVYLVKKQYIVMKHGTISKILECPRYQEIVFIKNAAYFSALHVEYNSDGSPNEEVWDVYRYTMSSNELIKLNDESLASEVIVRDYTDEEIIWLDVYNATGDYYFSTDYNFKNQAPANHELKIGNCIYEIQTIYREDGTYTYDIQRTDSKSGKNENVLFGIYSYRLDNMDNPKGIVYNTLENNDGRTVFYKKFSDLSVKELCRIPDEYSLNGNDVYPTMGTTLYVRGYIGLYVYKKDAEHSEVHNSDTMLFVHIDTGDMFVLSP